MAKKGTRGKGSSAASKAAFLKALNKLSPSDLDAVIPYLGAPGCSAIYECVHNVLRNGDIPNKSKMIKLLSPHKAAVRYLVDPKKSAKAKRGKLTEVGGAILAPILATAVPFLIDLISKAFK